MRKVVITKCTTQIACSERFIRGVELRVIRKASPNQATSIEDMNNLVEKMKDDVRGIGATL